MTVEPPHEQSWWEDPACEEIAKAYEARSLVVFAGSGVSTAMGLPAWRTIVEHLQKHPRVRASEEARREIDEMVRRDQLPDALQALRDHLGQPEFGAQIERQLDDQRFEALPEFALAIASLKPRLKALLTVNLDGILERSLGWPTVPRPTSNIVQRTRFVLKLHGTLLDRGTWVICSDDHERVMYADPRFRDILDVFLRGSTLLFVGYDLEDDDIKRALGVLRATSDGQPPRHFALLPADDLRRPYWQRQKESAGVRLIAYPDPHRDHAEVARFLRRMAGRIDGVDAAPQASVTFSGCPFPGLDAFDESHADVFLGRDAEINEALAKLGAVDGGHRRWLQVEGPSGVGKSSFVRAGLIPHIRKQYIAGAPPAWKIVKMRPGLSPIANLAQAICEAVKGSSSRRLNTDAVTEKLRGKPGEIKELLRAIVGPDEGVLLVIDQLEEAILLEDHKERARFDELLAELIRDGGGPAYLITALRGDFSTRLSALPQVEVLLNAHAVRYHLRSITALGIYRALRVPAQRSGLHWDKGLLEEVHERAIAAASDGRLPLMAHVLWLLWDGRVGDTLSKKTYDAIGGLEGALARSADAVIQDLVKADLDRARRLLLSLVRSEHGVDTPCTATKAQVLAAAGGDGAAEAVLERLAGRRDVRSETDRPQVRLVVIRREGEESVVELVHNALLREWKTLRIWLDEDREVRQRQQDFEDAVWKWKQAKKSWDFLPVGERLKHLQGATPKDEESRDFLKLAVARDDERRRQAEEQIKAARRRLWISVAVSAVLLVLLGMSAWQFSRANSARWQAERATRAEKGARAVVLSAQPENALEALLLGIESVGRGPGGPGDAPAEAVEGLASGLTAMRMLATIRTDGAVRAIAFSPDGSRITTADSNGWAKRWGWRTGEADWEFRVGRRRMSPDPAKRNVRELFAKKASKCKGNDPNVPYPPTRLASSNLSRSPLALSPDGGRVSADDNHGYFLLWGMQQDEVLLSTQEHPWSVIASAFSWDGVLMVTASDDCTARLWDAHSGELLQTFEGHDHVVEAVAISADGRRVLTGSVDGTARLWDTQTGAWIAELARRHSRPVSVVAFSPDGNIMLTGSEDNTARLWKMDDLRPRTLSEMRALRHEGAVLAAAFSPGGALLATGCEDGALRVWMNHSYEPVEVHRGHSGAVYAVAFSPDGSMLATGGSDTTARVWSVQRGMKVSTLPARSGGQFQFSLSSDGLQIVTPIGNTRAQLWDATTGTPAALLELDGVTHEAAFSADGLVLATRGPEFGTRLWDARTGVRLALLGKDKGYAKGVTVSRDKGLAATASSTGIAYLWRIPDGKILRRLPGHDGGVMSVAFAPDTLVLLTADEGGHLWLWDTRTGQLKTSLATGCKALSRAEFSPDGGSMIAWCKAYNDVYAYQVQLWDTSGKLLGSIESEPNRNLVAVSLSGAEALTVSALPEDGDAEVRSVLTGGIVARLRGHTALIGAGVFSADGNRVVTSSLDRTVRLWDTRDGKALAVWPNECLTSKVAISGDGQRVAAACLSGLVNVYRTTADDFLAEACEIIRGRPESERVADVCGLVEAVAAQ